MHKIRPAETSAGLKRLFCCIRFLIKLGIAEVKKHIDGDHDEIEEVKWISFDELKEDIISELDEKTTVEKTERIIAIFKEVTCLGIPRPMLSKIYDLHYHKFVRDDMLHTVYQIRTKENPKVKQLLNKGGLITWQKM